MVRIPVEGAPEAAVDETAGSGGGTAPRGGYSGQRRGDEDELERATRDRLDEEETWEKQSGGEVDTQTKDTQPSAAHTDSETTGGEPDATATAHAAAEFDERYLRLAADFENYKRQTDRRIKEARDRAVRSVFEELLPVLDNFERAVDAAKNAKDVDSVRVGVEFILQQFQSALKSHGVEPIEASGKPFDPLHHDALEEVSGTDLPHGTVVDEAQRGYTHNGQILRTSRVRVAG